MPRMTNKKKAGAIKTLWEKANSSERQRWMRMQQRGYDFFLNDQLSKEEQDTLEEAGMPTFIINRITPAIEMMKFFVTANSPRWQAVGQEGSDTDIAAVHADVAAYCWHLSNGESVFAQVVQDALTKGIGYFLVDVDQDKDNGLGEVVFNRIEPFDVYIDPMSRDFVFRDASYIIVKKDMPKFQLEQMYPDMKRKIKAASGSASSSGVFSLRDIVNSDSIQPDDVNGAYKPPEGEDDEMLDYYECYTKEKLPFYNVSLQVVPDEQAVQSQLDAANEDMEIFREEALVQSEERKAQAQVQLDNGEIILERYELEVKQAEKEAADLIERKEAEVKESIINEQSTVETKILSEEEYNLIKDQKLVIDAVKFYDTRIKLCCVAGDKVLYEYHLNNSEYPIVPVPYTYTGTPYPMSSVTPLVGKQQEINKAHQLMIHNANLASNLRWLYEEGSVPEEEWEMYSSSPGALLKYRQGFTPPTPVQPLQINQAFYQITQEGKEDIEYISGVPRSLQGDVTAQHETYRGLLAQDEYGTRRIKAWMQTVVEPALEHLGRIFKETAQDAYSVHKVFRIVQPGAGSDLESRTREINVPIYNDYGEAISRWNDYQSARFDVRIVAGSTQPVNRWALIEEYFRWFQSGLIDDIAMLGETDIRNKESIIKRKSLYAELKSTVEALQDQLVDRDGTIETLSRQVIQAGIKDKVSTGAMEVKKDVLETKAQQKFLRRMVQEEQSKAKSAQKEKASK